MFPTRVSDIPPSSFGWSITPTINLEEFISDALGRKVISK